MTVLMGIDLSASCTAAIAVPLDWSGNWTRTVWTCAGEGLPRSASDRERAVRTESIGIAMAEFAVGQGVTDAYVESYAFSRDTAAHTIAEVGGVVRLYLLQAGVNLHTTQLATARKLLLGYVPNKKALPKCTSIKTVIMHALQAAGAPFCSPDVGDAFVAVNLPLSELGGYALVQEPKATSARGRPPCGPKSSRTSLKPAASLRANRRNRRPIPNTTEAP
jgi:hypothetical protein